jgi:cell division protein FtsQ
LNELFSPVDLRLSELTLSERGSWDLVVNDRIAIAVGREKLIERVNRFIAFYQQETDFDRDAIAKVDLRYDNGLAIARVDESLPGVASR